MKNKTNDEQTLSHDEVIQEILAMEEGGSHDHAVSLIDIAIVEMRTKCADSPPVLKLADKLAEIISSRTNVKNAGKILGLSPPKGRPTNPDKAISDLKLAAEYFRQQNNFIGKSEIYGIVGENEIDSNGIASKYEANAMRVYRACKIWGPLFNSNDINAINRVLIDNDIESIKQ